jgi:hypothetical protein
MHLKLSESIVFILSIITLFSNCCFNSECAGCNAPGPAEGVFIFRLLDETTKTNLIAAWGAKYDSELVDLLEEDGSKANQLEVRENGKISFVIPDDSNEALDQEKTKTFFLQLPDEQGNPGRDVDTLMFSYRFSHQDCPSIWYKSFKVSYNDSLYHEGEFVTIIEFLK